MDCFVDYNTNEDASILTRIFKGTVTMTEIINSWEYVINNGLITKNLKGNT